MADQDNPVALKPTTIRWVLLADARRARLLRCGSTEEGRCRVEERGSIDSTWPRPERSRSGPLWKNATIPFGIEGNAGEGLRRFAREVVKWLQHRMEEFGILRIHILASGRFLGAFRKVRPAQLTRQHALEREADLMHLSVGRLVKHPVILQLMDSACPVTSAKRRYE